jgi:hypothetical protein
MDFVLISLMPSDSWLFSSRGRAFLAYLKILKTFKRQTSLALFLEK